MKKKLTALAAALLALTMLAGCAATAAQEPTKEASTVTIPEVLDAEGVYKAMCEAVDGKVATSFTSTTQMGAEVAALWRKMDADMTATIQVTLSQEPWAYHSVTTLDASIFGMDLNKSIESYSAADDTGLSCYFHIGDSDTWYHHQSKLVPTDLMGQYQVTACTSDWVPQGLALEEAEGEYILRCTYDAETVLSGISSPFGELSLGDADVSGMSLAVTYRVDAATFMPREIQIEYRGISAVVSDLISKYAGKLTGGSAGSLDAEVHSYVETLSDLNYEAVEVPQVPQSAIENSTDVKQFNPMELLK